MYKANIAERSPGVKNFTYADDLLDELEAALSRERLGAYLDATGGDRESVRTRGRGARAQAVSAPSGGQAVRGTMAESCASSAMPAGMRRRWRG